MSHRGARKEGSRDFALHGKADSQPGRYSRHHYTSAVSRMGLERKDSERNIDADGIPRVVALPGATAVRVRMQYYHPV